MKNNTFNELKKSVLEKNYAQMKNILVSSKFNLKSVEGQNFVNLLLSEQPEQIGEVLSLASVGGKLNFVEKKQLLDKANEAILTKQAVEVEAANINAAIANSLETLRIEQEKALIAEAARVANEKAMAAEAVRISQEKAAAEAEAIKVAQENAAAEAARLEQVKEAVAAKAAILLKEKELAAKIADEAKAKVEAEKVVAEQPQDDMFAGPISDFGDTLNAYVDGIYVTLIDTPGRYIYNSIFGESNKAEVEVISINSDVAQVDNVPVVEETVVVDTSI
jgi:NADH dehydrogenase/NADH:ubiquinone oxidoreductase subunit G